MLFKLNIFPLNIYERNIYEKDFSDSLLICMNFVRCSVTLTIYFKFSYIALFFYKPIVQLNIHEILHINCFYYRAEVKIIYT